MWWYNGTIKNERGIGMSGAKRIVAIVLSCIMLFTIVSCSQHNNEEPISTEDSAIVTTTEKTDETKKTVSTIETSNEETRLSTKVLEKFRR